jgi:ATP-dependent RNA helicase DDX5/DBP2
VNAELRQCFQRAGYTEPSVIQACAWPDALAGRDIVGVAKTGSGKTLGFLIPTFMRIANGPRMDLRNGPSTLVLAPTRELACQIREEVVKFGTSSGISSTCVYGGAPKGPQLGDVRRGVHIFWFFLFLNIIVSVYRLIGKSHLPI